MNRALAWTIGIAIFIANPGAHAGEPAGHLPLKQPAFTLPGLDGRQHELGEWRNKVILLNFWASWCSPCQTEIRDLVAFQARYGAEGLQIVGIGMDDETKLRNVSRTFKINYPVLFANSLGSQLMSRYGNREGVVPFSVLISREDEVVYTHTGVINDEIFIEQVMPWLK